MSTTTQEIEIDVPVRVAYNDYTQFEHWPKFMSGVESITQLDDKTLQWKIDIGGHSREFTTEITEQIPDQRIAWNSVDDPPHAGVATFHRLDDSRCRVTVQMEYEPEGFVEKLGDAFGAVDRRLAGDLKRFKAHLEESGHEDGAWRGEIHHGQVSRDLVDH